MARFAKRFKRRSAKRASGRRGFMRRIFSSSSQVKPIQIDSMAYGAARQYLSNWLAPVTAKVPLGSIADEVVMGGVCYLAAKNTSGMIRDMAVKGLVIENARLGEAIISGQVLGGMTTSSASGYTYG